MQIQTAFCLINITLTSKRGSHVTVQSSLIFQINLIITSCAITWLDVLIEQSHSLKKDVVKSYVFNVSNSEG